MACYSTEARLLSLPLSLFWEDLSNARLAISSERLVHPCSVYERAFNNLRDSQPDAKEEAVMLLEAWRKFEQQAEATGQQQKTSAVAAVEKRMPKRIKRKRAIETEDGSNAGMEVLLSRHVPQCISPDCFLQNL